MRISLTLGVRKNDHKADNKGAYYGLTVQMYIILHSSF